MTSALVANVTNNAYIVLSQETSVIHDNKYNYKKIKLQIIPKFGFLCEKIKLKQLKYIFGNFL